MNRVVPLYIGSVAVKAVVLGCLVRIERVQQLPELPVVLQAADKHAGFKSAVEQLRCDADASEQRVVRAGGIGIVERRIAEVVEAEFRGASAQQQRHPRAVHRCVAEIDRQEAIAKALRHAGEDRHALRGRIEAALRL